MTIDSRSYLMGFIVATLASEGRETPLADLKHQCKLLGMTQPTDKEVEDMIGLMVFTAKLFQQKRTKGATAN